jgi:hypothetical protein
MANEEHLARLKEGVEAWKQWREANRDIRPDLTGANLVKEASVETDFLDVSIDDVSIDDVSIDELYDIPELGMNLTQIDLHIETLRVAPRRGVIQKL